jgi:TetR/AcrR family transcriptional repressor of nem operon
MRYDPEHRQRTREKVVRAAAVAIRKHGPDRIGVAGLMAKAGLTHGGFYAHFKSKDELVAEAISYMFDDRYAVFRKGMEDVEPAQGLAAYVDRYLTVRHRDQPEKGCPLPSLSGDLARMPTAARKRFEDGTRRLTDSIADALRAMKRPHPDALAASVLAEMVGAMAIARAVSNNERSEQILEAARNSIKARIGLVA